MSMPSMPNEASGQASAFTEAVEVRGHIIDSLILPKVLDIIKASGGSFRIQEMTVGQSQKDPSFALVQVYAGSEKLLREILSSISDHGAVPTVSSDCQLIGVDVEGALPEGFYCTTNQRTEVRLDGKWVLVQEQEMDCAIVVDPREETARCKPMNEAHCGEQVVIGHVGTRVLPESVAESSNSFEFMNSSVSTEKPKGVAIRKVAKQLQDAKDNGGKTLVVGGPAIVHTGSGEHFCWLVRNGYIDVLFAGNALATHDIEQSFFGTSLGVRLDCGDIVETGHEHHLRSINRIRRVGSISAAVETGALKSGIMYECVRNDVPFLLAGSIRDDGPLPDVVTDSLVAQQRMRQLSRDATFCLMIATTLHSVAVGNLLPAWVQVVCVDINPSTVIKLNDRGSMQTVGLVTDVEPFMRSLVTELEQLAQQ